MSSSASGAVALRLASRLRRKNQKRQAMAKARSASAETMEIMKAAVEGRNWDDDPRLGASCIDTVDMLVSVGTSTVRSELLAPNPTVPRSSPSCGPVE